MEFSVVFTSCFTWMWFDYGSAFLKDLLLFFSFGLPKFLGFHSPWFQKSVCLEAKIGLCFLPKGWFCLTCFSLFDPYLSLGWSFFEDKLLWQAYLCLGILWTPLGSKQLVVEGETLLFFAGGACPFLLLFRSKREVSIPGNWVKASIL